MGQINIYKIDNNKKQIFYQAMSSKFDLIDTIEISKVVNEEEVKFGMTLYISQPTEEKDVNWNWLLREFNVDEIKSLPNPKSVLLIEKEDVAYAATFGFSYFIVDKYCDRSFAFNFARKIDYKEIRTTALTTPNSQRNKVINTYINYNNLEFDSGESFTKIKAKTILDDNFTIYKETIEIGYSLKFTLAQDTLENIADLIQFIEDTLATPLDKNKIPVFTKVQDNDLISSLEERLQREVMNNPNILNISEIDIIGATEVFNHNDTDFTVSFKSFSKDIEELCIDQLRQFSEENGFSLSENLLNIKVISYNNGVQVRSDIMKNLIDYTDDVEKCILSKGQWYHFNDDYLSYLADSIKEIDAVYNPNYNFNKALHREFLNQKYNDEKDEEKYIGKTEAQIRDNIKKKYYTERYFNIKLAEDYQFENYDRNISRVGTANIELADLYKDNTIFAVKIGNSSGKLCYAVDQSIQALKAYKKNLIAEKPLLRNVGIWFILDRTNQLSNVDGKPDINELDMLILKNRLDSWKKEVRINGYKPIIYINYVVDGDYRI